MVKCCPAPNNVYVLKSEICLITQKIRWYHRGGLAHILVGAFTCELIGRLFLSWHCQLWTIMHKRTDSALLNLTVGMQELFSISEHSLSRLWGLRMFAPAHCNLIVFCWLRLKVAGEYILMFSLSTTPTAGFCSNHDARYPPFFRVISAAMVIWISHFGCHGDLN